MIFLLALFLVPFAFVMFFVLVSWVFWPLLLVVLAVVIVCKLLRGPA